MMLITNIGKLITMESARGREGELGVIKDAAVLVEGGEIKWIGLPKECSAVMQLCRYAVTAKPQNRKTAQQIIDAKGCAVLPGLIDCHTHLVHAGNRVDEFAMRARGASYEEIARAGGGIMSTVRATRSASEDELFALASERAREALAHGITTLEVKSGYGLDLETELKMLRVVRRLGKKLPQEFVPTFLAHMVPVVSRLPLVVSKEVANDQRPTTNDQMQRSEYVYFIIHQLLPAIAAEKLARFCDVFVEKIAFTKDETEKILKAAAKLGMRAKLHADQLSAGGGAGLAAKLRAVSADHLEHISKKDILAMAKAGVTAVLIPSSTFFIGKGDSPHSEGGLSPYAPARELIEAGIPVAISTDYNPGTSPILNLWLAATFAITQMKLTPEEAYKGITINAARALGMEKTYGSIEIGKVADFVILSTGNEFDPFYRFDKSFVSKVIKGGKVVYESK